jgi:hypothetical protein
MQTSSGSGGRGTRAFVSCAIDATLAAGVPESAERQDMRQVSRRASGHD